MLRRTTTEVPSAHYSAQVALDQGHCGAFHRHISARAHRDLDIGRCQCRGIIDAIAGHGDAPSFLAGLLDHGLFLVGQDIGENLVDRAALPVHSFGGASIVPRHHDDPDAAFAKRGDSGGGGFLDRIRDHQQPAELPDVIRADGQGGMTAAA